MTIEVAARIFGFCAGCLLGVLVFVLCFDKALCALVEWR